MKEYKFKINDKHYEVSVEGAETGIATVLVNGTEYSVEIDGATRPQPAAPRPVVATAPAPQASASAPKTGGSSMKSPLPGVILDVRAHEGEAVKQGQVIMILEAMKMENNIDAHKSGTLTRIVKRQGDTVLEGDELFVIE